MQADPEDAALPIVWSVAGNDPGGGAGLWADQRAAAALGVHLCPVVAALAARNSRQVARIEPVASEMLDAQLAALAADMPPAAIKSGLLGSADNVTVLARWVDRLREQAPLALVVDPVLGAGTGAAPAGDALLRACRELLLPRSTLVTTNERDARRLAGPGTDSIAAPQLAQALQGLGAGAVAVTGGDSAHAPGLALDWIDTEHARGWLALSRIDTRHTRGAGCTFAASAAGALALGFVPADALVLAKMAATHAIAHGYAAGQGPGPVAPRPGFGTQPDRLPVLSWGEHLDINGCSRRLEGRRSPVSSGTGDIGLYAIVDSAERVRQVVAAGVRTVQLRIKTPALPDVAWHAALRDTAQQALAACRRSGATLVVNDHWRLAAELAAGNLRHLAIHLGQEDLLALGAAGRAKLASSGLRLGVSSHSLWELARARGLAPWYAACGPVWPTLTKAMPWHPQGPDNLAWWVHMAGVPVVAIGGVLEHAQAELAARSGAAGVCIVRGLGADPALTVPRWQSAWTAGRAAPRLAVPALPHPSLAIRP